MSYQTLEFIWLILVVSVIPWSNQQQQNPNAFYPQPQSGPGSVYGGQQNPQVPYNPQNPSYNQNPPYNQNPQFLPGGGVGSRNGIPLMPGVGLGPRDYGDICDTTSSLLYPSDENKGCNPVRGLYCNQYAQRCACIVPGAIYREGKCRAKVNKPCIGTDAVHIDCAHGSYCNALTRVCQCKSGLLSNAEETACNGGQRGQFCFAQYLLLLIATRSIFVYTGTGFNRSPSPSPIAAVSS